MTAREFAERYVILTDDFNMNCLPVAEWIQIIHEVEEQIESGEWDGIKEFLETEIEEYEDDDEVEYHVDAAKELLDVLNNFNWKE